MPALARPLLTVIIPAFNASATIGECLQGVLSSGLGACEILVVDDASTDDTRCIAAAFPCRVIALRENRGPAHARNVGAREARAEALFFSDADFIPDRGALAEALRALREDEVVAGGYSPEAVGTEFFQRYMSLWKHYTRMWPRPPEYVSFPASNCFAIRRSLFERVGGFEESYRGPDVEDFDLGHRLAAAGARIRFRPAVRGRHRFAPPQAHLRATTRRAAMWLALFARRRRFDSFGAGGRHAAAGVLAGASFAALPLSLMLPLFLPLATASLLAFLALHRGFFALARKRYGTGFMLRAIGATYVLSLAPLAGAGRALMGR